MSILINVPLPEVERSAIIIVRQMLAVPSEIASTKASVSLMHGDKRSFVSRHYMLPATVTVPALDRVAAT